MICNEFDADSNVLVSTGDFHVGNRNTDLEALKKMINDVRKNGYQLLVMGDQCECITNNDKRFDMGTIDPQFLNDDMIGRQYKYVEKLLKPVASQIIGMHCGNHDYKITKISQIDMVKQLCENLEVPNLGYSALTHLRFVTPAKKSTSFTIYSTHGYASGRMRGGKVNAMEGLCSSFFADLYLAGHSHDLFATATSQMYFSKMGHLSERILYYGNTGTFMKGIVENCGSYAEHTGYKPNKIGYLKTTFNLEEHRLKTEEVIM